MRFTVNEYSKHFKMSKEMVYAKLRQKQLNYIMEEGVTYIIVPQSADEATTHERVSTKQETPPSAPPVRPKTTVGTIIALYQRENQHLKHRIKELEAKIDKLIDDKEQMLIGERNRIEQIYSTKDEQLKTILNLVNTKLMLSQDHTVHDVDVSEEEEEDDAIIEHQGYVELKKYLKTLELNSRQRKIIKKRFATAYGNDSRVLQQNGAFYLDFDRFDYSDLLDPNL